MGTTIVYLLVFESKYILLQNHLLIWNYTACWLFIGTYTYVFDSVIPHIGFVWFSFRTLSDELYMAPRWTLICVIFFFFFSIMMIIVFSFTLFLCWITWICFVNSKNPCILCTLFWLWYINFAFAYWVIKFPIWISQFYTLDIGAKILNTSNLNVQVREI